MDNYPEYELGELLVRYFMFDDESKDEAFSGIKAITDEYGPKSYGLEGYFLPEPTDIKDDTPTRMLRKIGDMGIHYPGRDMNELLEKENLDKIVEACFEEEIYISRREIDLGRGHSYYLIFPKGIPDDSDSEYSVGRLDIFREGDRRFNIHNNKYFFGGFNAGHYKPIHDLFDEFCKMKGIPLKKHRYDKNALSVCTSPKIQAKVFKIISEIEKNKN